MKIIWTNKWSKEQGYVKSINKKGGYFENTFDASEAKSFSAKTVGNIISWLNEHEPNNTYNVIQ